jgi:hypothetical protein
MTSHADAPQMAIFLVFGVAVGGVLLLAIGILFWALFRHSRRNRELLHTERMKALELGQPASFSEPDKLQEKYAHNAFWIAFWVGAGVPMVAAGAAAQVMTQANVHELGLTLAIWGGVAVISIASVICATVLMVSARHMPISVERTAPRSSAASDVH